MAVMPRRYCQVGKTDGRMEGGKEKVSWKKASSPFRRSLFLPGINMYDDASSRSVNQSAVRPFFLNLVLVFRLPLFFVWFGLVWSRLVLFVWLGFVWYAFALSCLLFSSFFFTRSSFGCCEAGLYFCFSRPTDVLRKGLIF